MKLGQLYCKRCGCRLAPVNEDFCVPCKEKVGEPNREGGR